MAYTYDELKDKTVAELREIAATIQHEAVQGYSQLNKEHLLVALCKALDIDTRVHHVSAAAKEKGKLKQTLKELKKARDEAIAKKDKKILQRVRHKIHTIKRVLRAEWA
jgi:hypothetical protein